MTENELYRYPREGGWQIRIFPNKYPALRIEGNPFCADGVTLDIKEDGPWGEMQATGAHEVVVESPNHGLEFHHFSPELTAQVFLAVCERYHDLRRDRRMNYFFYFRNTGEHSGRSLRHPHSQIVAATEAYDKYSEVLTEFCQFLAKFGKCLYCAHLEKIERTKTAPGSLLIAENDCYIAFAPYAPEFRFETWVMPRQDYCRGSFAHTLENHLLRVRLGEILREVAQRITAVYKPLHVEPSYNMGLYTAPYNVDTHIQSFHWHIRIFPRGLKTDASFELTTGLPIPEILPEYYAAEMKAADISEFSIP